MKTISPRAIWRFLLAVGAALAVLALAHAVGPDACGGMPGAGMPPHLRGLNLNEAQRDKVFELMHAHEPSMRDKAKSLRRAEEDLRALLASPDFSEAKARALADVSAKAMFELTLARARMDRQIFELLTLEQRRQLAEDNEGPNMGRGPAGECPGRSPMR